MAAKKKTPTSAQVVDFDPPTWSPCFICGERYDVVKDPNHREACLDSVKP